MTHGILVIDKPLGMTSHDVVARVRKVLHTRKVGHAGTLDPDASGVLVLCVGDATRLLEYLTANRKSYEAEIAFGRATDTDDASGETLAEASAATLTEAEVSAALPAFTGGLIQQVPAYSAVHIDGVRAYDLARRGESFDLPARAVQVHELVLRDFKPGETAVARVFVDCSKGTYIRSLARDMGRHLGIPAHLAGLRRTASGQFSIGDAVPLAVFEEMETPIAALLPLERGAADLAQCTVDLAVAKRLCSGQSITLPAGAESFSMDASVAVMSPEERLLAIARVGADGRMLRPHKVFWKKDC